MITPVDSPGKSATHMVRADMAQVLRRQQQHYSFELLPTASLHAERFLAQVRQAATNDAPVWLFGESGSGKETAARIIHAEGPRRERSFLRLDCRGIQPYLMEGILFGKGGLAATGHVGTLFLKEPSLLPRDLQSRIADWVLNSLSSRPRLISADSQPAMEYVRTGKLIPTFHTQLSVVELRAIPLRDRPDDLCAIVDRIVHRLSLTNGTKQTLSEAVVPVLRAYPWPGNIRELATVLCDAWATNDPFIGPEHLPRTIRERHLIAEHPKVEEPSPMRLDEVLEAVEKRLIERALAQANQSVGTAAEALGIPRARLGRRIEVLKITPVATAGKEP
jgi:DNA-binding NtrC family response regulator